MRKFIRVSSDHRKKWIPAVFFLLFLLIIGLGSCGTSDRDENAKFEEFTKDLFCREVSSNTISLHYTLQNPEEYQIEKKPAAFGSYQTDAKEICAGLENLSAALGKFSYEDLDRENRITYDVISGYLEISEKGTPYVLYSEPLNAVSGVQTQLPVLLSEYSFYDANDADTYLELLTKVPEYFDSLIAFEQKKSQMGMFMPDSLAQTTVEQCRAFVEMRENNYLISTFVDRIKQLEMLTKEEKSGYIQKNAEYLEEYVIPSYEKLIREIGNLRGSGTNEKGLCGLPGGKAYYEYVVAQKTGSSRSVEEMRDLTRKQILDDLQAMEKVLGITEEVRETMAGNPENMIDTKGYSLAEDFLTEIQVTGEEESGTMAAGALLMLSDLEEKISGRFPELPRTRTRIKTVPKEMQEHLSPAFYMIPEIDHLSENVIYLNERYVRNDLSLFTTLAHEGYPGHLYQTVYYASLDPDPVRMIFNFGGYVEGWATYAEMCSYYLADLSKEQATLLQKNASIILGLYSLADIGIHYDGWSREDALAFFSAYGIADGTTVNRIYDLILGDPGNYLKYYIGYLEFLELKKEYASQAQDQFSQKEFHKKVLDVGPAPFDVVEKYMNE